MKSVVWLLVLLNFTPVIPEECTSRERGDIRIIGTEIPSMIAGRIEICVRLRWRAVYDTSWGTREAEIVCTGRGFPAEGASACRNSCFGNSSLDEGFTDFTTCNQREELIDCGQVADTGHFPDINAGVVCVDETATPCPVTACPQPPAPTTYPSTISMASATPAIPCPSCPEPQPCPTTPSTISLVSAVPTIPCPSCPEPQPCPTTPSTTSPSSPNTDCSTCPTSLRETCPTCPTVDCPKPTACPTTPCPSCPEPETRPVTTCPTCSVPTNHATNTLNQSQSLDLKGSSEVEVTTSDIKIWMIATASLGGLSAILFLTLVGVVLGWVGSCRRNKSVHRPPDVMESNPSYTQITSLPLTDSLTDTAMQSNPAYTPSTTTYTPNTTAYTPITTSTLDTSITYYTSIAESDYQEIAEK